MCTTSHSEIVSYSRQATIKKLKSVSAMPIHHQKLGRRLTLNRTEINSETLRRNEKVVEYYCDYCAKSFYHAGALEVHLENTHEDEIAHDQLNWSSISSWDEVRAGLKKHVCLSCGKRFKRKAMKKIHYLLRHKSSI